jgi:hypothetical protein
MRWLRRLLCGHYWVERELAYSDFEISKKYDGFNIWICTRCGKRIFRRSFDPPISSV